jgi:hypothetical protein
MAAVPLVHKDERASSIVEGSAHRLLPSTRYCQKSQVSLVPIERLRAILTDLQIAAENGATLLDDPEAVRIVEDKILIEILDLLPTSGLFGICHAREAKRVVSRACKIAFLRRSWIIAPDCPQSGRRK